LLLGGPVRAPVAVAALEVGPDDELDDGVETDVLLDEELDELLLDEELDDGSVEGVLLLDDDDELDEELGAVVGVVVEDEVDDVEVDVEVVELDVGGVSQPVTQKTLCLTSAPRDPSALIVSLTWNPCCGCGAMPVKSSVYVLEASRPAVEPPPLLSSSPMNTVSVRSVFTGPVGGCASNLTLAFRLPWSKP
jgi:hypothetical protein